jgi:hypothetical protein
MGNFNLMYLPESSGSNAGGKTQIDIVSEAKAHDMRGEIPEN